MFPNFIITRYKQIVNLLGGLFDYGILGGAWTANGTSSVVGSGYFASGGSVQSQGYFSYLHNAAHLMGEFTTEFWVNRHSYGTFGAAERYVDKNSSAGGGGFGIVRDGATDNIDLVADGIYSTNNSTIPSNTWTHIVGVRKGTVGAYTGEIYINGRIDSSSTVIGSGLLTNTSPIYLGYDNQNIGGLYINAEFDDFRLWNQARTSGEIALSHNRVLYPYLPNGGQRAGFYSPYQDLGANGGLWYNNGTAIGSGHFNQGGVTNGGTNFIYPRNSGHNMNDFTAEIWLNLSGWGAANARIMNLGDGNGSPRSDALIARQGSTDKIQFFLGGTSNTSVFGNNTIPTALWTHICVVRSGTIGSIYISGILDTQGTVSSTQLFGQQGIYLNSFEDGTIYTNGTIDEFRLWNYARSPSDILANYNKPVQPRSPGLINYINFDGNFPLNYLPFDSNQIEYTGLSDLGSLSGVWSSNGSAFIDSGYIGKGGLTTGQGYFSYPHDASHLLGEFTAEFWVKRYSYGTAGGSERYVDKETSDGFGIARYGTTDTIGFAANSNGFPSISTIATNTWTHIACVRRGEITGYTGQIFINGSLDASNSSFGTGLLTNNGQLRMGFIQSNNAGYYINADFDEFRLWNYARSSSDISANYNQQVPLQSAGLINYLRFEPPYEFYGGNGLKDYGLLSGSWAKQGSVGVATDKHPGSPYSIAGYISGGYFEYPFTKYYLTTDFTAELWVRVDSWINASARIVAKFSDDSFDIQRVGTSNNIRFHLLTSSTLDSATALTLGTWYHIACVRQASNAYIYINGTLDASTAGFSSAPLGGTATFKLGNDTAEGINGMIQDFRFWNYARSATDIANNTNTIYPPGTSGLINYLTFNV